jgi:IPT/TIG domain
MKNILLVLLLFSAVMTSAQTIHDSKKGAEEKKTLVAKTTGHSVSLSWVAPASGTPAQTYNVYRFISTTATCPTSPTYTLLGTSPMVSTATYTDSTVTSGNAYCYVVTALDIPLAGTCSTGTTCESGYSNQVTAVVPLVVSSLSPASGPTTGGTPVTITGTGFLTGDTVTFGSTAATSVVVVNSTTITAVTPVGSAGTATVTVTGSNTISGNETNAFTFVSPAPNPPTGLTVGTITAKSVPLSWKAPAVQSDYPTIAYEVFRGANQTLPSPGLVGIVPSWVTSFTDTGCVTSCYYEVKAYAISGNKYVLSVPSNIVKAVM